MVYSKIVDEDVKEIIEYCKPELLINTLKNKTVLITGAFGMVGSYFVYTLLKLNELYDTNTNIIALVRDKLKADEKIKDENCKKSCTKQIS